MVAEAQAKAAAQIKETQDRLAADAAKRQAEVDAELHDKLAEAEARIGAAKDAALAQIQGIATDVARLPCTDWPGSRSPSAEVKATVERVLREAA